jgi:hypothetical protein
MEAIGPIIAVFIIPYLPIESDNIKFIVAMAIGSALAKLLGSIKGYADGYNLFSCIDFFNREVSYTITSDDPFHKILADHIHDNHSNRVMEYNMINDNGLRTIYAERIRGSYLTDTFDMDGTSYNINITQNKNENTQEIKLYILSVHKSYPPTIITKYIEHISKRKRDDNHIYQLFVEKNNNWMMIRWDKFTVKLSKMISNTIMSDGVDKHFYSDIKQFMGSEQEYYKRGIPYRRGYALYGHPGCGKTSIVKAIAREYAMPIFLLDINRLVDNNELSRAIRSLHSNVIFGQKYIVIMEDFDRSNLITGHEDNKITRDFFLNFLDGIFEKHGMIAIITANNMEKIREYSALLRPGRIDKIIEVGLCTIKQIENMLSQYYGDHDNSLLNKEIVISPSHLMKLMQETPNVRDVYLLLNTRIDFSEIH